MIIECGLWEINTKLKKMENHNYFVAKHKYNPSKIELIFCKGGDIWSGKKELIECLIKEKIY